MKKRKRKQIKPEQAKIKACATIVLLAFCIFGFSAAHILLPDANVSKAERRPLAQMPDFGLAAITGGTFMSDFEKYSLDQFPMRDWFRSMKACSNYHFYRRGDNNGIYIAGGTAVNMEYPLDSSSVKRAAERFRYVYRRYLADTDANVYVSVIPDKNFFTAAENGYLHMDYETLTKLVTSEMDFAFYIDIFDTLTIYDYYKTDIHWRQENITDTADRLAKAMGARITGDYRKVDLGVSFYGVYYGQAALPMKADRLCIMENNALRSCTVYDFESGGYIPVYDESKLESDDFYDIFLSGSKSLLVIENPCADTKKELIMFRDSFGSSLAPLLVSGYSKITLIDIRYISLDVLDRFVEFRGQDVLFIYSTSVLNNSITIK